MLADPRGLASSALTWVRTHVRPSVRRSTDTWPGPSLPRWGAGSSLPPPQRGYPDHSRGRKIVGGRTFLSFILRIVNIYLARCYSSNKRRDVQGFHRLWSVQPNHNDSRDDDNDEALWQSLTGAAVGSSCPLAPAVAGIWEQTDAGTLLPGNLCTNCLFSASSTTAWPAPGRGPVGC